jgi:hypothetical protein
VAANNAASNRRRNRERPSGSQGAGWSVALVHRSAGLPQIAQLSLVISLSGISVAFTACTVWGVSWHHTPRNPIRTFAVSPKGCAADRVPALPALSANAFSISAPISGRDSTRDRNRRVPSEGVFAIPESDRPIRPVNFEAPEHLESRHGTPIAAGRLLARRHAPDALPRARRASATRNLTGAIRSSNACGIELTLAN